MTDLKTYITHWCPELNPFQVSKLLEKFGEVRVEAYGRGWRDAAIKIYWTSNRWNEGHYTFFNGYVYTKTLEGVNSNEFFDWSEAQLKKGNDDD